MTVSACSPASPSPGTPRSWSVIFRQFFKLTSSVPLGNVERSGKSKNSLAGNWIWSLKNERSSFHGAMQHSCHGVCEAPAMEPVPLRIFHDLVMVVRSFCMAKNVPERHEPKKVVSTVWVNRERTCFRCCGSFWLTLTTHPSGKSKNSLAGNWIWSLKNERSSFHGAMQHSCHGVCEAPAMEPVPLRIFHDLVMVVRSFCMAKNVPERHEPKS